jgi:hypothetical protein
MPMYYQFYFVPGYVGTKTVKRPISAPTQATGKVVWSTTTP